MFIGVTLALQVLVGCASLEARLHQSTLATSSEPTTAIVLRTYGDLSKQEHLVNFYLEQLENTNYELSVLHDAGNSKTSPVSQEEVRVDSSGRVFKSKTSLVKRGGYDLTVQKHSMNVTPRKDSQDSKGTAFHMVSVCSVSWAKAEDDYGAPTMDTIASLGTHSAHDEFLSLWYRHCDSPHASFTWFLEDDVRFSGQIANFFQSFETDDSDLLSSGFRIAGRRWWKYNKFSNWLLTHTTNFAQDTKVIKNVDFLPDLDIPNPKETTHGVLFFQDHILRASDKLLKGLEACFDDGRSGPSESLIAQICGSQLYFTSDHPCTILDFAPVTARDKPNQWVSSKFWNWDSKFEPSSKEEVCSPDNENKWFHKCESEPEYFDCRGSSKTSSPQ